VDDSGDTYAERDDKYLEKDRQLMTGAEEGIKVTKMEQSMQKGEEELRRSDR
jgi:hypothetical protein